MNETQTSSDEDISPGNSSIYQMRLDPVISCVSMKSDSSMPHPENFKNEDTLPDPRKVVTTEPVSKKMKFDQSDNQPETSYENVCPVYSYDSKLPEVLNTFKSNLKKKFECLYKETSHQGTPTLLNEIYTELYITESESVEICHEHEVRQIETQSKRTTEDTPIKCNDIFKALPEQHKPIRSVLTKGVAGIGKTVSVHKFILDWTEGKENQDIHLIIPLPFRELNLMKNKTLSLLELLHLFYPETKEMEMFSGEYKVLFIFDGLDECRLSLDFHNSVRLCDVRESVSVDVILSNLIAGNLLPSALIWITSRPAAADLIPSDCVDRVTVVRGFTDKQKEEYFRKRISDKSLNNRIISHLKSSRSLYIMCHIPVFCWISATVLERMLSEAESEGEIPKTLTQMYTHFLIIQTNIKHQKDYEKKVKSDEDMMLKLGKLAFEQLVKGNVIFYEEDLRECDIDVAEASVYSGLCTQIFREEFGLCQKRVYCFVHLSIQEYLAALYAHVSFTNNHTNVFQKSPETKENLPKTENSGLFSKMFGRVKHNKNTSHESTEHDLLCVLHQIAVEESLQSQNGHLDLFLRFLLGLSLPSNQILLQDLLKHMRRCSYKKEETVKYIKQKINENPSTEKSINLIHCLNELDDDSLLSEIQHYVKSKSVGHSRLSSSQWSALVFVLLMSDQYLDALDLNAFIGDQNKADKVLVNLQPVIKESRRVQLCSCSITYEGCIALCSALGSNPSHMRELNLTNNNLRDSGVKLICDVLKNPHCKLEKLELFRCSITDEGCVALYSALRSNPLNLTHLDLSKNKLKDTGVKKIFDVLENPSCKLENLGLMKCSITAKGCDALSSALSSNPSHLKHLNLSKNNLRDSGVKKICEVLENPRCKLETLEFWRCSITEEGCVALSSALRSNPSHLTHLDLSENNLRDSGLKLICDVLKDPRCKLEKLWMFQCSITDEGCVPLSSALRSNPSHLRDLNLSMNKLRYPGLMLISTVLDNPHCILEKLNLRKCSITAKGCVALSSALRSNPSHLRELDLSENNVGDSGVKLISAELENPRCKVKKLVLSDCSITAKGCVTLASALRSNPSHLTHLDLSKNNLRDSGVKLISNLMGNHHCKLEM